MTLREELEELANMAARRTTTLGFLSGALRTLATSAEAEKPGEALPEVLRKARRAQERYTAGAEDGYKEARSALSAIEGYRLAPQDETARLLRSLADDLEEWNKGHGARLASDITADMRALADRLTSAIEAYRPTPLPDIVREVAAELRTMAHLVRSSAHGRVTAHFLNERAARLESAAAPEHRFGGATEDAERLGYVLAALLHDYAGETGENEGAADTMRRLLAELRQLREENARVAAAAAYGVRAGLATAPEEGGCARALRRLIAHHDRPPVGREDNYEAWHAHQDELIGAARAALAGLEGSGAEEHPAPDTSSTRRRL